MLQQMQKDRAKPAHIPLHAAASSLLWQDVNWEQNCSQKLNTKLIGKFINQTIGRAIN